VVAEPIHDADRDALKKSSSPSDLWPNRADRLIDTLRRDLDSSRFHHVLGVLSTALGLAASHRDSVTQEAVAWAALLHDIAKVRKKQAQRVLAEECGESIPPEDEDHSSLWHAWAGAGVARRDWGADDEVLLDAIRYHPTGHPAMGPLGKTLMLADYLEPTRGFEERRGLLAQAHRDLDGALAHVLRAKIDHLERAGRAVHPRTAATLEALGAPKSQEV
jgi:predicted HD superfamily hydrolase involved in NAD metabolism